MPENLYHYCGPDGLLGILSTQEIWCTHINYFHDPSEREYGESLVIKIVQEILTKQELNQKQKFFLEMLIDEYSRKERFDNIFVACFCESPDLLSQWERFANRSTGFSIGFKFTDKLLFGYGQGQNRHSIRPWILKVIYDQELQNTIVKQQIDALLDYLNTDSESKPTDCFTVFMHTVNSILYAFKKEFFSEEKEWRILINSHICGDENIDFRVTKDSITPFVKIRLLDNSVTHPSYFPLKQIWMGPKTNENDRKSIQLAMIKFNLPQTEIKESHGRLR